MFQYITGNTIYRAFFQTKNQRPQVSLSGEPSKRKRKKLRLQNEEIESESEIERLEYM